MVYATNASKARTSESCESAGHGVKALKPNTARHSTSSAASLLGSLRATTTPGDRAPAELFGLRVGQVKLAHALFLHVVRVEVEGLPALRGTRIAGTGPARGISTPRTERDRLPTLAPTAAAQGDTAFATAPSIEDLRIMLKTLPVILLRRGGW